MNIQNALNKSEAYSNQIHYLLDYMRLVPERAECTMKQIHDLTVEALRHNDNLRTSLIIGRLP